jgi:hypothetical protein
MLTLPSLLVTLVLFGLFCGGLAVAGMIGDSLERWLHGGQGEQEIVDNYPVHHATRRRLDNFPR